jgi:hypothetical protein
MTVGLNRASLFGIKKETVPGVYAPPAVGADVLSLRPGNELSYEPEPLTNDELLNDIGEAKASVGKEKVSGKHPAYLRHSGVEGQEPQLGLLYESIMGSKYVVAVERVTIAGSTISVIKVGAGLGVNFKVGQALLIKDGVNGYSIRNVKSISGDDLTLNFNLNNAPGAGIGLGKAIVYIPAPQGHPVFSTTKWLGNGFAKECSAGNTATDYSLKMAANGYGEVEFSFEGTQYLFNPLVIGPTNKYLDFTDDTGTLAATVPEGVYKTPIELADALNAALNALSTEDYTVSYNNQNGKFTIASTSTVLSLLMNTGVNAANTIGTVLGFDVSSDKTGAVTYSSASALDYSCAITPSFDTGDLIVLKGAQLLVGDVTDNVTLSVQEANLAIKKSVEDVDDMCVASGIAEKIPTGRTVEMSVKMTLRKHDASLLDALLKNKGIGAMLNAGPKVGGNLVAGKCFNIYFQSATVSKYVTTGDSFIQVDLALKGFVTTTTKDIYLSFV